MSNDALTETPTMTAQEAVALLLAADQASAVDMPAAVREAIGVVCNRLAALERAALPAVDLDALKQPGYDEWRYGAHLASHWPNVHAVTADPDPDGGDHVYIRRSGWSRDELPDLAGFLMAVHAATDPVELEKRFACDCGGPECDLDDIADGCELEHVAHPPFCASHQRPVTS